MQNLIKDKNISSRGKIDKILEVAGQMFMSDGYGSISMDKLAESIPVSKRTLYNNFKDKKTLFAAVMERRCQTIFNSLEQNIKEHKTIEQTLVTIGDQFMSRVLEPSSVNIYRTAITESKQFPELCKLFYENGPQRGLNLMADFFKALNDEGKLTVPNPELSARIFIGMLTNRIHMEFMLGIKKQLSTSERLAMVKYAVKIFLEGHKSL